MDEKDKKSIQSNFSSLVERTDLDLMVNALYERGVFSEQMMEPYRVSNNAALYSLIQRKYNKKKKLNSPRRQ